MNTLIITPIHPMEIMEVAGNLNKHFGEINYVFSLQMLALMLEEAKNFKYPIANYLAAEGLEKKTFKLIEPKKNNIIFGNIPKHLTFPLQFNNIIYFNTNLYEPIENENSYLAEMEKAFAGIKDVDWFHREDIPFGVVAPTFRHLNLLLKSFGHKMKEE